MQGKTIKTLLGLGTVVIGMSLITGCNTVRGTVVGAGEDMQVVGHAMAPQPVRVHKVYHATARPVKKHYRGPVHHKKMHNATTSTTSDTNTNTGTGTSDTASKPTSANEPATNQNIDNTAPSQQ